MRKRSATTLALVAAIAAGLRRGDRAVIVEATWRDSDEHDEPRANPVVKRALWNPRADASNDLVTPSTS